MIEKTGIDAFSFDGTKAGAMMGKMIVLRCKEFANYLQYSQKNARIGNEKAKSLEQELTRKGIKTAYKVQSNMVFAIIEPETFAGIRKAYNLHYWNDDNVVRLATTYLTTNEQIQSFVSLI